MTKSSHTPPARNGEGIDQGSGPSAIADGQVASPVPSAMHFDLDPVQSLALANFLTDDAQGGVKACLSVGIGHSGMGLYAFQADYPEEGAILVAPLVGRLGADA